MRKVEMGCGRDTVIGIGRDKWSIRSFVIVGGKSQFKLGLQQCLCEDMEAIRR